MHRQLSMILAPSTADECSQKLLAENAWLASVLQAASSTIASICKNRRPRREGDSRGQDSRYSSQAKRVGTNIRARKSSQLS